MAIIMTLWIGNGAVLNSSSPWQLKEFWKINNSAHEFLSKATDHFSHMLQQR